MARPGNCNNSAALYASQQNLWVNAIWILAMSALWVHMSQTAIVPAQQPA